MRIAYVCADPGIPVFGSKGASVHVQEVIRALRVRGAKVELFACRWGGEAPSDLRDLPLHELPAIPKGDSASCERAALQANDALADALEQAGPFDAVYERYSLWSHAGMAHAARQNITGLLEVNAPLIVEQRRHRELVDTVGAERVAKRVFDRANHLLAVSRPVADYLTSITATPARIHVVPNGVDIHRFTPARSSAVNPDKAPLTVGFLGTLKPWHGLPLLIEAFARLQEEAPASRLLIVGDGPERERLQQRLDALGLAAQAHFTGAVSPGEVPTWLAQMNVAVASYPDQPNSYFSPLKLFEYLAMGLPIVASRIGQAPEIIEHEVNGLLYPADDVARLTEMLARLHREPDLRRRLGRAGRRKAVTSHTWDAVAGRILTLIEVESAETVPTGVTRGAVS